MLPQIGNTPNKASTDPLPDPRPSEGELLAQKDDRSGLFQKASEKRQEATVFFFRVNSTQCFLFGVDTVRLKVY